ncbi:response regulator [Sorangium sp. So ce315]|uniref:response regulator n=1 Tax=Sorangium sp. So ce315 TaxID=3133299 RepID=UPI003F61ED0B
MSEPRPTDGPNAPHLTPIPPNSRAPVLLVDDDAELREMLREMLEAAGYDVYCASNGKEALDLLHAADPPPGLILLDLMMPIMTGEEMLAALKQVHALAAIPVTIVSGHDTPPEGAPYLKKPVDFGALLGVVQKTCG